MFFIEYFSEIISFIKRNKIKTIIIILITIIIALTILLFYFKQEPKIKTKTKIVEKIIKEKNKTIMVDIKGQINKPGVFKVRNGTRINDVINMAGGLTYKANTRHINLSKKVKDEMVIIIYSNKEIIILKEQNKINEKLVELKDQNLITENDNVNGNETKNKETKEDNKTETKKDLINLNTATLEELMTLSGVGESKAKAIIKYREEKKFKKIEDLMEVSGIGESTFEKLKDLITV